jgi:hypothetical protein
LDAHPLGLEDERDLEGGAMGFAGEGAFQLMDLGKGDTPRLGLRAKKKEVGVTLGVGVQQVCGKAATECFQFSRRSARQEMGMSQTAFLGRPRENFFNAGGRERHGGVPPECG